MPTYKDLVELANICARHARGATNKDVVAVLWKMAEDYQSEANSTAASRPMLVSRLPVF
jgi:uncharacterized membrane protein YjjP (DUF1212 family)